jgi:hypothetical protein
MLKSRNIIYASVFSKSEVHEEYVLVPADKACTPCEITVYEGIISDQYIASYIIFGRKFLR